MKMSLPMARGRYRGSAVAVSTACAVLLILILVMRPSGSARQGSTALPGMRIGQAAPDFTLRDLSGKSVRLAALRGHIVLLNFWSSTCPPCLSEMPALERAYRHIVPSHRAPVILGIEGTPEDAATVAAFARRVGVTYPLLLDSWLQVTLADYHVGALPTSVVVDTRGRVREVHLGALAYPAILRALYART